MNENQKEELKKLIDDITSEATKVRKDYEENPSEISGSVIQFHENSPYLATRKERLIKIDRKN